LARRVSRRRHDGLLVRLQAATRSSSTSTTPRAAAGPSETRHRWSEVGDNLTRGSHV
jgi:hypothetical protein